MKRDKGNGGWKRGRINLIKEKYHQRERERDEEEDHNKRQGKEEGDRVLRVSEEGSEG